MVSISLQQEIKNYGSPLSVAVSNASTRDLHVLPRIRSCCQLRAFSCTQGLSAWIEGFLALVSLVLSFASFMLTIFRRRARKHAQSCR